ncbi:hypothetical protein BDR26DRAFT_580485 [Obelidium mucronatum]|nr:hypothetical protein BDR26DRAFT_580485 [Obelidium mucronatum]
MYQSDGRCLQQQQSGGFLIDPKDPKLSNNDKKAMVVSRMEVLLEQVILQSQTISALRQQIRFLISCHLSDMEEAVRSEKLKGGSKKEKSPNHSRSRSPIRSVIVPDNATEFDDKVVIDDDFKNEETVAATPTQASSVAITPTLGNSLGRTPAALALWSDKSCNVPAAEDAKPNPGDNHWRLLLQTFPDDHEKGGIETDGADNSLSSGLSLLSASVAMALKKGSTLKKNDSLLVAADTKQSNKANSMQNIDLDYSKFSIKIEEDHEKRGIEVQQPKQNFGGLLRTVTAKNSKHFDDNDEFLMPSSGDGNVIRSKTEKSSQAVSSSGLHNSTAYPSSHFPHKAEGNIHDELFVRQSDSKRSVTKSAKSIGNTSLLDLETNAIISKSSNATKSPRLAVHTPLAVAITISDSFSMLEDYEKGMPPIPDYSSEGLSPFVSLARKMTLPRSKSFKHAPPNITVDGPDDCPDVPELPVAFKTGSLQRKKMPTQHSRDRIIWTNSYTESPYNLSVSASRATIDRSSPALSIPLSDMKTSSTVGESELGQEDDNNDTNSPYRRLRMFISTAFCPLLPNGPTRNFWLPIVSGNFGKMRTNFISRQFI